MHLKARHAKFNRKSDVFKLKTGTCQGRSFAVRWSRGTKTRDTRVKVEDALRTVTCANQLKTFCSNFYYLKGHCHGLTCAKAFTLADLKKFSLRDKYVYGFSTTLSCIPLCHHTFFSVPSCSLEIRL